MGANTPQSVPAGTAINDDENDDVRSQVSYNNSEGYYTDNVQPNKVMLFNDDITKQFASTSASGNNQEVSSNSAFSMIAQSPLGQYSKAQGYMVTKAYGFGQEKYTSDE